MLKLLHIFVSNNGIKAVKKYLNNNLNDPLHFVLKIVNLLVFVTEIGDFTFNVKNIKILN